MSCGAVVFWICSKFVAYIRGDWCRTTSSEQWALEIINPCQRAAANALERDAEQWTFEICEQQHHLRETRVAGPKNHRSRSRLRLEVSDVIKRAEFVLFNYDPALLLSKTCASMVGDVQVPSPEYPEELNIVIGNELLFKVEVKDHCAFKFDDSFKVKKICCDENIITEFKEESSIKTPEMAKLKASMSEVFNDELAAEGSVDATDSVALNDLYNYNDAEILLQLLWESAQMLQIVWLLRSGRMPPVLNVLQAQRKGEANKM
ncbi:hypothetical protein SESBI_22291 [Sesbania bispinosa]|nr:hypothetical protein SESBI_22291 [Sesbania bispinosa]